MVHKAQEVMIMWSFVQVLYLVSVFMGKTSVSDLWAKGWGKYLEIL